MRIDVQNRCSDFNSYRAARVKSLFNAESGANFDLSARVANLHYDVFWIAGSNVPTIKPNVEIIGNYDPKKKGTNYKVDLARIDHWVKNGAQMSDTVRSIVKKARAAAAKAA